ncbi:MAG: 16S rRNA (guanine(966)-N(2))-methyltransferase RsmD [Erysipelothrix sp.]|nr:16S rRNA (guanine(966)-N(2))-methyltransferase RsmD [Erysipelothrix sp.]
MRIIAGKHRSRRLESVPSDKTRPTLDKIKESLFQRIGPYFDGGHFLDLFAGSGSIGLEALSRGIDYVVLVDNQKLAINTIEKNVKLLKEEENVKILRMDYQLAIDSLLQQSQGFEYIYCDPPYHFNDYEQLLSKLKPLLKENGLLLVECEHELCINDDWETLDVYTYRSQLIYKLRNIK